MGHVVVLGSINMDVSIECDRLPHEGETINGSNLLMSPGGKGANQAVAAARAGACVQMIGAVGSDAFGSVLCESLAQAGVATQLIAATPGSSGVAVVLRSNQNNRIIIEHGANYALDETRALRDLNAALTPNDVLLIQFECSKSLVEAAITTAHAKGCRVIVNPSPARSMSRELIGACDVLCLNETECEQLFGITPTIDENGTCPEARALQEVAKRICAVVQDGVSEKNTLSSSSCSLLVTLGAAGSMRVTSQNVMYQPSFAVHVQDTTAAGDTFVGYLAACLAADMPFEQAQLRASYAAALATTKVGAQLSIPTKQEVESYFSTKGGTTQNE
ncbi:putative ribokinase [Fannyhessea vaginae PB189-T1-4]|uniref:Ribokinase n=1 Tax=Fannyhessea vaginae PB189-T1-4 TaxID=866774 RepID=A0ABN0AZK6_9ACTN|nr:ribokinase [Fannyhessea vaginae]EFL43963.1 putative ribokinase [Fannyhessea vaginae PB189-T1-4]